MPTRIMGREEIGLECLLGHRDAESQRAEVAVVRSSTTVRIEAELSVGQVSPLGRTERRTFALSFLVPTVKENDVAVGLEPFAHQLDGRHSRSDVSVLHVAGASTEEVAA